MNRLARPRKSSKPRKADAAVAELHKVLFVVQLLCLVDAPGAAAADDADLLGDDVADERLMLWVDDHPENNSAEIAKYGPKYDVAFVQLNSSSATRAYLARHTALNQRPASRFRLISDRHRDDEPGGQAGPNLIRSLRRDAWHVPALLYCGDPNTVWGVPDVIALQTELSDLLVCCTQLQLDLYLQTMLLPPPTTTAASSSTAVAEDDGYASAADDIDAPESTVATTAKAKAASATTVTHEDDFNESAAEDEASIVDAAATAVAGGGAANDDGSTTEEDFELQAAAEREAAEREAAKAAAAAAAKAEAEAKAAKARAAAEAKARAAAEAAEAKARAAAEAKAKAEAEARARAEAEERERRLRQLARVEGDIPSDCRCGETISFELRAFDGRDDLCDERLFVEATNTAVAEMETLRFTVTRNALGVWRCHAKLTVPGRYDVSVTSTTAEAAWLVGELRCAPGRATTVRVRVEVDAATLGELSALWLAPLDACGNVTALETNRRLDVRLVGRSDELLENDTMHSLDALVERTAAGGEYRCVFFPTRAGVYDVRVLTRGDDITAEPRVSVLVEAPTDANGERQQPTTTMKRKERQPTERDDDSAHNADKRARTIVHPEESSATTTVDMEGKAADADDDADLNDIDAILEQVQNKPSDSARTQVMDEDDEDDGATEPTLAFGAVLAPPPQRASNKHADSSAGDDDDDDDRLAEPTLAFLPPVTKRDSSNKNKNNNDDDNDDEPTVPTLALDLGGGNGTVDDRDLLGDDDDDDDDDADGNEPTLLFDKPTAKAFEFKSPLPPVPKKQSPVQQQQRPPQQQPKGNGIVDVFADIPASEVAAMAGEQSDDEPTVDKTAFELPTLEI